MEDSPDTDELPLQVIDLCVGPRPAAREYAASVLLERCGMKVRRIELAAGARIPPCQMQEDVVFAVLTGRVLFRADGEESVVASPGAVFIPGGATTRSMEAQEESLVLGVLCNRQARTPNHEGRADKP
jgi:quercetin dioxygenase-like cupin family protein